jgi:Zn-dependent M28 family amino/carboxypeptidase
MSARPSSAPAAGGAGGAAERARHSLVVLLPAALLACAEAPLPRALPASPAPRHGAATPVAIAPDPSSDARIAADLRYLASEELGGRGTGDEGARLAAAFLEGRLAEIGLSPFGDEVDGARTFRQRFEARVGAAVAPPKLAIRPAKGSAKGAPEIDASAIVTADGSASGEASGEAVFAGYGIAAPALGWDDYAGLDVAGKIAVVLDGTPPGASSEPHASLRDFGAVRYKLRTAREHEAAGVVVLTQGALPATPSDASSMGLVGVVARAGAVGDLLRSLGADEARAFAYTRPAGSAVTEPWRAAEARRARPRITLTTRVDPVLAEAWNVVGLLRGSSKPDEHVVVGAHYDHLGHGGSASRAPDVHAAHPGADDNASGTALVLEVARRLAGLPQRPARSVVIIAFSAEEIGALGSRYWVDHAPAPMSSVVAMINADMVGRLRDRRLLVDGAGTAQGWPALVEAASGGLGLDLSLGAEGFGASDHASFTAARVPVAFLFTGVHDDYHLPSDTFDRIEVGGVSTIATLAARLAFAVADRPERLAFVDAPRDPHRGMSGGFRVSLGTIPDYAFAGRGVRLTGARPDAPASRAGLTAGDVIVRVGGHAITNVHDYVYALGDLEPGREIDVEIVRDGKSVVVKVIPAPGR